MSEPMRVCLLLDGATVPRWQADALAALFAGDAELTTVVFNAREQSRSPCELLERAVELREWTPVAVATRLLSRPVPQTDPVPVRTAVADLDSARTLRVQPAIVDGWKQRIPEAAVAEVEPRADVAVRFGFGFLVGPILSELEHGVLSYHHGDLRAYRGQPMGFWEFLRDEPTAGVTVQQLTERLDAGAIAALETVPIDDLYTWGAVRRRLFDTSEGMLATAVANLRAGEVREPESLGDLYTLPRGWPVAKYAAKNSVGYLREEL